MSNADNKCQTSGRCRPLALIIYIDNIIDQTTDQIPSSKDIERGMGKSRNISSYDGRSKEPNVLISVCTRCMGARDASFGLRRALALDWVTEDWCGCNTAVSILWSDSRAFMKVLGFRLSKAFVDIAAYMCGIWARSHAAGTFLDVRLVIELIFRVLRCRMRSFGLFREFQTFWVNVFGLLRWN